LANPGDPSLLPVTFPKEKATNEIKTKSNLRQVVDYARPDPSLHHVDDPADIFFTNATLGTPPLTSLPLPLSSFSLPFLVILEEGERATCYD
jgi:hypothetical protein